MRFDGFDGTVAALVRCYQTDKKSPHRGLAQKIRNAETTTGVVRLNAPSEDGA
jgi:hypothetical protein